MKISRNYKFIKYINKNRRKLKQWVCVVGRGLSLSINYNKYKYIVVKIK